MPPDPTDQYWKSYIQKHPGNASIIISRNDYQRRIDNPKNESERNLREVYQRNIDAIDRYTIPLFTQPTNE